MLWVKVGPVKNDPDLESSPLPALSCGETYPGASASYTRLLLGGSCGLLWKWLPSTAGLSDPWRAMSTLPSCAASSTGTLSEVTPSEGTPSQLHHAAAHKAL